MSFDRQSPSDMADLADDLALCCEWCGEEIDQAEVNVEAFEVMAQEAFDRLPEEFRALCADVIFNVTEFPDDDVCKELEAESPFDILGLFTGIGLPQQGYSPQTGQMPNTIHLYRRPILDYWAEHDETLGGVVTHVLVHEIGHHFGFSDEDMEAIEKAAG